MKTISQLLTEVKAIFKENGLDTPDLDARLLLQHATGMSNEELFLNNQKEILNIEEGRLRELVQRRLKHEPVSRIVGQRSFWKYNFRISSETLDPRADSETLIEAALRLTHKNTALRVLDLGTGTGCLLISLLREWPHATGVGLDVSVGAVVMARQNADALGVGTRAELLAMDWNDYKPERPFDIVISNPPYIAEHEMASLESEVALYDPVRALVAGADGLECYRSIIEHMPKFLKADGLVLFEVGCKQSKDVSYLLAQAGMDVLNVFTDLAGNDRVVVAKMT